MAPNPIETESNDTPWILVRSEEVGDCANCELMFSEIVLADTGPLGAELGLVRCGPMDGTRLSVEISRSAVELIQYYRPFKLTYRISGMKTDSRGQQLRAEEVSTTDTYYFKPSDSLLTSRLLPRIAFSPQAGAGPRDAREFRFSDKVEDLLPVASLEMHAPELAGVAWRIVVSLTFDEAVMRTKGFGLELRARNVPFSAADGGLEVVIEKAEAELLLRNAGSKSIPLELNLERSGDEEPFGEYVHADGCVIARLQIEIEHRDVDGTLTAVAAAEKPATTDITLLTGSGPLLAIEQEDHPKRRQYINPGAMPLDAADAPVNFAVATMPDGEPAGQVFIRLLRGSPPCSVSMNGSTNVLDERRDKLALPPPRAGRDNLARIRLTRADGSAEKTKTIILRLIPSLATGKTSLVIDYGTCAIAAAVVEQGETATPLAPGDRLIAFDNGHDEADHDDDAGRTAALRPSAGRGMLIASHVGLGGPRTAPYMDPDRRPISAPWRPWAFPETMRGRPNGGDNRADAEDRLGWLQRTYDVMLPFARADDKDRYNRILFGAKVLLRQRRKSVTLAGNGPPAPAPMDTSVWHRDANGVTPTDDVELEPLFKDILEEFLEIYVEAPGSRAAVARQKHLERERDVGKAVRGLELILTHPCGLTRIQRKRYKNAGAHVLLRWRYGPLIRLIKNTAAPHSGAWSEALGPTSDIMQSVHLVAEPLAAACAVLRGNKAEIANFASPFDLLIIDIGAGTTDVVLLDVKEAGDVPRWSIKASHTCRLGGNALDCLIAKCGFEIITGSPEIQPLCDAAEWRRTTNNGGVTNPELSRAILKAKRMYSGSGGNAVDILRLQLPTDRQSGLFSREIPESVRARFSREAAPSKSEEDDVSTIWFAIPLAELKRHLEPFLAGLAREVRAIVPRAADHGRRAVALTGRGSLFPLLNAAITRELAEFTPIVHAANARPTQMKLAVANGAAELLRVQPAAINHGDASIDLRLLLPSPLIWWAIGRDGEPESVECGEIDLSQRKGEFARRRGNARGERIRIFVVPCGYGRDDVAGAVRRFFERNSPDREHDEGPDEGTDPDVVRQFGDGAIARPAAAYSVNLLATGGCAAERIVWTLVEADPEMEIKRNRLPENARRIYNTPAIDLARVVELGGASDSSGTPPFQIELDGPIMLADGAARS